MPFEIFPQSVTLFPGDTQKLTFRATPPPVLWYGTQNASIDSSYRLVRTTSGTYGGGIAQRVHSGIAGVEWTFTSDMLPTGAGYLELRLFGVGVIEPTNSFLIKIQPTQITVFDKDANTIDTVTHTIASGDKVHLEIAGQLFRFYLNDTLETVYDTGVLTEYPCRANFFGYSAMASATPKISPPRFIGEWDIEPLESAENDWTITGGSLNDTTDAWQVTFTADDKPGVFDATCTVENGVTGASTYQKAASTIIIPPLTILSPSAIELQPGEVIIFRTNYDNAQTAIVAWAVESGGGSFTNGRYTAATAPGASVIKATSGDQLASVTITVPAVMTITVSGSEVGAVTPSEVLTLTTNMTGTVNWTASVGTLSSSSGGTVTWTAPGQDGLEALITATNGTYTVKATIPVLKAFPYKPNRPLKWDRKKIVLVSQSENRAGRASRVKNANNEPQESFELTFLNRNLAELDAVIDFWDEHHPNKRFIFTDAHRSQRIVLWFDSDVAFNADAQCATTYTFRAIEG
jgi:hypothetical protein